MPPSSTRATRSRWPRRSSRYWRPSAASRCWAGAAAPTCGTSPRCGASRLADADRRRRAVHGLHALGDLHRLFDERLDDLRLRHGLDDLALDEDLALAVARRDAEVGLAGLAGSVHDTAHDGDPQRHLHALEPGGHTLRERVDVD